MKRSEIWWAELPNPVGSGLGYKCPVLIVQANSFNDSRIAMVIAATITSNLMLAQAPGNVRIAKSDSGLPEASVINISQPVTLDRDILVKKSGLFRVQRWKRWTVD